MFGPNDPGYSAATIGSYMSDPAGWQACRRDAHVLVGCAYGHVIGATADDIRQARRYISRAVQLFMRTGLTAEQAANQVVSYAQMLGSLE